MNKKILVSIISLIVLLMVLGFVFFNQSGKAQSSASTSASEKKQVQSSVTAPTSVKNQSAPQIILFYGNGCPHCAKVEKYIEDNQVQKKISLVEKEIYGNRGNVKELMAKAKICGMSANSVGVPFLWNGEKCFMGDQDIINFLKQKVNK